MYVPVCMCSVFRRVDTFFAAHYLNILWVVRWRLPHFLLSSHLFWIKQDFWSGLRREGTLARCARVPVESVYQFSVCARDHQTCKMHACKANITNEFGSPIISPRLENHDQTRKRTHSSSHSLLYYTNSYETP